MFITKTAKKEGILVAQMKAGHKSVRATERYIHYTIDDYLKEQFNTKKMKVATHKSGDQNLGLTNA